MLTFNLQSLKKCYYSLEINLDNDSLRKFVSGSFKRSLTAVIIILAPVLRYVL